MSSDYDDDRNLRRQSTLLDEIAGLLDERERLVNQLVESRREESAAQDTPFGRRTYSELAATWREGLGAYLWAPGLYQDTDLAHSGPDGQLVSRLNTDLVALESDARRREAVELRGAPDDLPGPDRARELLRDLADRSATVLRLSQLADDRVAVLASDKPLAALAQAESEVGSALDTIRRLSGRREPWVADAVRDITSGRIRAWTQRRDDIQARLAEAMAMLQRLRPHEPIAVGPDADAAQRDVDTLLGWLDKGGEIKLDRAGRPKPPAFGPRTVKEAWRLFDQCSVHGKPAYSADLLRVVKDRLVLDELLKALDAAWPAGTEVSHEDSPLERLAWHEDELQVLEQVLALPKQHTDAESMVSAAGLPPVPWTDSRALES